jgi:KDO2-lipid IV(A) lauroyltransferase
VSQFRHNLEYGLSAAVGSTLRLLPRPTRLALGRLAGGAVFALDRRHRKVTLDNLDRAYGSAKTDSQKWAIARGAFRHFGAMFFELLSLGRPSRRQIEKIVEFEGVENFEQARAAGRGVIIVSCHFGNWEIHGVAHGYRLGPIAVVARLQDNPHYNRLLERFRTASGNSVFYKQQAVARVMRWLKEGGVVAILIDQNVGREDGVFVDFFGRKAATSPIVGSLALKTGAAVVPVFALPLADGRYRMIYEKPVDARMVAGLSRPQAVLELTQHCARVLESYVRESPEYWLWMHRRWKTRPLEEQAAPAAPGEPSGWQAQEVS